MVTVGEVPSDLLMQDTTIVHYNIVDLLLMIHSAEEATIAVGIRANLVCTGIGRGQGSSQGKNTSLFHGILISTCETTTEIARAWTYAHRCGVRGPSLAGTMRHPLSIPCMCTLEEYRGFNGRFHHPLSCASDPNRQ